MWRSSWLSSLVDVERFEGDTGISRHLETHEKAQNYDAGLLNPVTTLWIGIHRRRRRALKQITRYALIRFALIHKVAGVNSQNNIAEDTGVMFYGTC